MTQITTRQLSEQLRWWGAGFFAFLLLTLPCVAVAQGGEPEDVVVRIQPGVSIDALAQDYNTTVDDHVPDTDIYSLFVPAGMTQDDFIVQLRADPRVIYVEADDLLGAPEVGGSQMHLAFDAGPKAGKYRSQSAYRQVHLGRTHDRTRGAGVIVAVVDTGVALAHPALQGHFVEGYNAIHPGTAPLDLPDGQTNAAVGHGTMIAGIIARLAPEAKIMPVRVLNGDGVGKMMDVVKGIHYAVVNGAKVINLSFGAPSNYDPLSDVLDEAHVAGVVVVASAGNDGAETMHFPAGCGDVLSVASVEAGGKKSAYSNYGTYIRVAAPGSNIRSTYWTGGYATWSGTSFATPFVTSAATLVLSAHPALRGDKVFESINETARSVDTKNPAYAGKLGNGIIDIQKAVRYMD